MRGELEAMPPAVRRAVEERETTAEVFLAWCRLAFGIGLTIFHYAMLRWRFRGVDIPWAVVICDVILSVYGVGLLLTLRRMPYRWWRKYVLVTVDILYALLMFVLIRAGTEAWFVSYLVLYPVCLLVALCSVRYSPRLALYAGGLALAGFTAYLLGIEGFQPFLFAGWILTAGFVAVAWYAGRGMVAITAQAVRQERLTRFFSPAVVEEITRREGVAQPGGDTVEATVLFADIRGFTTLSESMSSDQVVALLNEYFGEMVEAIFEHGGWLDKFIGDAVMAVFGAPMAREDAVGDALRAALAMLARLAALNERREARSEPPIRIGIGIHTGPVTLGSVGHRRRMDYTVIGDTVNVASRLEGMNKELGTTLLLSGETARRLGGEVALREVGEVRVKGRSRPVPVHTVEVSPA